MNDIWTIKRILNWTTEYFGKKNVPEPRLSAEILLGHVLNCRRMDLYVQFERILSPRELENFRGFVQRRARQEPVQYITGEQEFMGLNFKLTPDVLIPRFDTEILVDYALSELEKCELPHARILDVGSGSGIIACSLAHAYPSWQFTGIDISGKATEIARLNAAGIGLSNVRFETRDGLNYQVSEADKYHFVVSNPPYIAEAVKNELAAQVRDFEPAAALFAGKDGLDFYRKFIPVLPNLLAPNGVAMMEIGHDQGESVAGILSGAGFLNIKIMKDYQKLNRVIRANL